MDLERTEDQNGFNELPQTRTIDSIRNTESKVSKNQDNSESLTDHTTVVPVETQESDVYDNEAHKSTKPEEASCPKCGKLDKYDETLKENPEDMTESIDIMAESNQQQEEQIQESKVQPQEPHKMAITECFISEATARSSHCKLALENPELDPETLFAKPHLNMSQFPNDGYQFIENETLEENDEVGNLKTFPPFTPNRSKRLSVISMASSIAALAPFIWSSKENNNTKTQLCLPYEIEASRSEEASPQPSRTAPACSSRMNYRKRSPQHIKDMFQNAVTSTKQTRRFGIASQTVADWTTALDASFDERLGNVSRFKLEMPTINDDYLNQKVRCNNIKRTNTKLETWKRKSRSFLSGLATSHSATLASEQIRANNQDSVSSMTTQSTPSSTVKLSARVPSLNTSSSTDSYSDNAQTVETGEESLGETPWVPVKNQSRKSRFHHFLKLLIGFEKKKEETTSREYTYQQ